MGKRARGKAAQDLAKRAKARTDVDDALGSASWSELGNVAEEPEVEEEASDWEDEEQDYENLPRAFKAYEEDDEVERLPVKTADGNIKRVVTKQKRVVKEAPVEEEEEDEEEEEEDEEEEEEDEDSKLTEAEKVLKAKEEIANLAEHLNEDPEENIICLRKIRDFMHSKSYKVKYLSLLALVPIFKSLIPGYRIRPLTETEKKEKVTKEVKKLRNFEETLLLHYKGYIDHMSNFCKQARVSSPGTIKYVLGNASIKAACELIKQFAYFNYRNDLVSIIVDRLSRNTQGEGFDLCLNTIEDIFQEDDEGHVSFECVRLISKMIKSRRYKVDERIITTFLHLRLLSEFDAKASKEKIEKEMLERPKLKKKDRIHLSKKMRKNLKHQKEIEQEMAKAETVVSSEERHRLQGETLKLVFVLYFNILKERSSAVMGATLEGLAKFAHLINAEFFGDLLEALREIIEERQIRVVDGVDQFIESTTREALLCIVTAFALLSGQAGESMNLDLTFFINHFYSMLYSIALNPDIEFSHKTLRLDDPLAHQSTLKTKKLRSKVNVATEIEMAIRSIEGIFFRQRNISKLRIESFAKRLSVASLHCPEKSTIALLRVLDKMLKKFSILPALFSTEDRVSNGVCNLVVDMPEHSNPEAATIWETILLEKHYSPKVAEAARAVPRSAIVKQ